MLFMLKEMDLKNNIIWGICIIFCFQGLIEYTNSNQNFTVTGNLTVNEYIFGKINASNILNMPNFLNISNNCIDGQVLKNISGGWNCSNDFDTITNMSIINNTIDSRNIPYWISLNGNTTSNLSVNSGNIHITGRLSTYTSKASAIGSTAIGSRNLASNNIATVVGGEDNIANGLYSLVLGGAGNVASGYGSVASGNFNVASGFFSSVLSGATNTALNSGALVVGGLSNTAAGDNTVVVGGINNLAGTDASAVFGGVNNIGAGQYCFIGGGNGNYIFQQMNSVVGGEFNNNTGRYGFIGGGSNNFINTSGRHSSIVGGDYNKIYGDLSIVAGGYNNVITNDYGFAMGKNLIIGEGAINIHYYNFAFGFGRDYQLKMTDSFGVGFGKIDFLVNQSGTWTKNFTGNFIYGRAYNFTEDMDITPIGVGIYHNLSGLRVGELNEFTYTESIGSLGGSRLTVLRSGLYKTDATLTVNIATGGYYGFGLVKNYVNPETNGICYHRLDGDGRDDNLGLSCFQRLNAKDNLTIVYDDEANPVKTILMDAVDINIIRIGD